MRVKSKTARELRIRGGPRGLVGGGWWLRSWSIFGCRLFRLGWTGFGQPTLLDRLTECITLEAEVLGDLFWAPTRFQQLLCLGRDLGR